MKTLSAVRKLQITSRDSKLSWLTLAASVLVLQCSLGFLQGFGILYNAFLEEYHDSKKNTGEITNLYRFKLSEISTALQAQLHGTGIETSNTFVEVFILYKYSYYYSHYWPLVS